MSNYPTIINHFYKNPSFENYIKIRHYLDPKIKSKKFKNKIQYSLFLYVIHMKYSGYEESYIPSFSSRLKKCFSTVNHIQDIDCANIYKKIMDDPGLLCMTDLDMLWLCFYATGDTLYSDQVKACALTKKNTLVSDAVTKTAAEWSYNNHVILKFIKGSQISKPTTNAISINDPLFFFPDQNAIMEKYKDE